MIGSRDSRKAALYRQLAALEDAGIPLRNAVDRVRDGDMLPVGRKLDEGLTPGEAWENAQRFTPLEVSLVKAGAKSGQLSDSFKSLSQVFEESANTKRALLAGLAYPFILVHLAIFLPKLFLLVTKGFAGYLEGTLPYLLALWGGGALLVLGYRSASKTVPNLVGGVIEKVPLLGGVVWRGALSHGISTFCAVYKAGVPVMQAAEAAAQSATLPSVSAGFDRVRKRLEDGATIGDAFFDEHSFPQELREAALTGSTTGKLDEQLDGAKRRLESEAKTQKAILITIVPIMTYLLVALAIGYTIVSFWTGFYSNQLDALTK